MKKSTIIWIVIVIVLLGFVWWSNMQKPSATPPVVPTTSEVAPTTSEAAPTATYTVGIGTDATLGKHLTSTNGMTLYYFTKDKPGVNTCSGVCATNWPAYTVSSSDTLTKDEGALGGIGTIAYTTGKLQVTYKGAPLYFWHSDMKPGDVLGQGIGGVWFVVTP